MKKLIRYLKNLLKKKKTKSVKNYNKTVDWLLSLDEDQKPVLLDEFEGKLS